MVGNGVVGLNVSSFPLSMEGAGLVGLCVSFLWFMEGTGLGGMVGKGIVGLCVSSFLLSMEGAELLVGRIVAEGKMGTGEGLPRSVM